MHALYLIGLIAGLAVAAGDDDKRKKTTRTPLPAQQPAKPATSSSSNVPREFTREPYRPRTERDYEPWRTNRSSPPPKKSTPSTTPKTQAAKNTAKPAEASRDPALKRCDDLRRRMEQLVREEGFGGDAARQQRIAEQKRSLYQEELRYGCI